jgi:hypothetical protein
MEGLENYLNVLDLEPQMHKKYGGDMRLFAVYGVFIFREIKIFSKILFKSVV